MHMKLSLAAGKAAFASALTNAVLFIAGRSTGVITDKITMAGTNQPVSLPAVVITSVVAVAGATLVYVLLLQISKHPKTIFNVLAFILLLLSFFTPFTLPSVPISMALLLNVMHVVVAFCVVYFLQTTRRVASLPAQK